ncbi:MAG: hypothetical protein KAS30_00710, partial [Candidatus Diapherotrites archaeon]|nr:hypothetical protein [Candidatus Diapherotrites archaeon]
NDGPEECTAEDPNKMTLINYSRWPTTTMLSFDPNWVETNQNENVVSMDGYDSKILDFNLTTPRNISPGAYIKRIELSSSGKSKTALIYVNVPDDTRIYKVTDQGDELLRAIVRATFENSTISNTVKVKSSIEQTATVSYSGVGTKPLPSGWINLNKNLLAFTGNCSDFACENTFDVSITVPEGQPAASYNGILTINANGNISKVFITLIVMPKPTPITYESYDVESGDTQTQTITAPVHIQYETEPPTCGNGECDSTETETSCPSDCGSTGGDSCGNGTCDDGETVNTCSFDCEPAYYCGDGVCTEGLETSSNCTADCGPNTCGDGACNNGESNSTCPVDCGSTGGDLCGNRICEGTETIENCAYDCNIATGNVCGDGACYSPETNINCPSDCGSTGGTACGDGICGPGETNANCNLDCMDITDANVIASPILVRVTPDYYAAELYDGTNDCATID